MAAEDTPTPDGEDGTAGGPAATADDLLAVSLAGGATAAEAAAQAGVSVRTAHRRMAEPAFRRRVAEPRGEMVQRALGRMSDAMSRAAETLNQLLAAQSETVRLGAARSIIEFALKIRDSVELAERVSALEAQLAGGNTQDEEGEGGAP